MNEFRDQLGALAHNVSTDFERASADDSAALIRRAKRGRIVWTGTVGTAALASVGVLAIGGNAAAQGVFGETISPAATLPAVSTSASPTPTPTPSESADDYGVDDSATHDANDDNGTDDSATHDANDDNGTDDSATDDVNDDNGVDTADSEDVNDDSGKGSDDSGKSEDSGSGSDDSGKSDDSGNGSDG